jgi:hypothetical protein
MTAIIRGNPFLNGFKAAAILAFRLSAKGCEPAM